MTKLNDIYNTVAIGLKSEIIEDHPTRLNVHHFTRHGYQINYNAKTSRNMTNKGGSASLLVNHMKLFGFNYLFGAVNSDDCSERILDFSKDLKHPDPREFGNMCTAARADYYRKRILILGD